MELGRSRQLQDLVTKSGEAIYKDSVGFSLHKVSVIRAKAIKAFYVFLKLACMLFNWVWV